MRNCGTSRLLSQLFQCNYMHNLVRDSTFRTLSIKFVFLYSNVMARCNIQRQRGFSFAHASSPRIHTLLVSSVYENTHRAIPENCLRAINRSRPRAVIIIQRHEKKEGTKLHIIARGERIKTRPRATRIRPHPFHI